jgi:hypothetical protein
MKHAQLQVPPFTSMLAKIILIVLCFVAFAHAASPSLQLVKEAKEICELEVMDFRAKVRQENTRGNEIRDFTIAVVVKEGIKGSLKSGKKFEIKGVQARTLHDLARPYEGDANFTLWCNPIAFREFQKGEKFLVIGSLDSGVSAITRPVFLQAHDEILERDIKSFLEIGGLSTSDEIDECSSFRVYSLLDQLRNRPDPKGTNKGALAVMSLIKKCRKADLVELANKFSEDVLVLSKEGNSPPEAIAARRQFFLASLAEVMERATDKEIASPKVDTLIKRHSGGTSKIRKEEFQGVAPQLSEKASRRLEKWIGD